MSTARGREWRRRWGLAGWLAPVAAGIFVFGLGQELWSRYLPEYLRFLGASAFLVGAFGALQDLLDAANAHALSSTNGVGALAYLHAGLRWERGFESRTTIGYRPSGTRVFVEAGGGVLAALPGGGDTGVGHPPGFHIAAGLIFKRTSAHPLTLTGRYVQALGQRDPATLIDSRLSWAVVQVGWLIR